MGASGILFCWIGSGKDAYFIMTLRVRNLQSRGWILARVVFLVLVLLFPMQVCAATLSGFVTDKSNGEALPYGNVVLKQGETTLGALTNLDGYYAVQNIGPGTYALVVSYIGYTSFQKTMTFEGKEAVKVDVGLAPAPIEGQVVVVEADPYEEERVVQTVRCAGDAAVERDAGCGRGGSVA